jgi:hypothetical protein
MKNYIIIPFSLLAFLVTPERAYSNERRFGYTYESSVLPPGAREIELWTTDRRGREYFYHRMDQRVEFEFGVSADLMSAFYLNTTTRTKDNNEELPSGSKSSTIAFSISNEWKYKMLDRVADPLGFAIYGEITLGTDKIELESKLITDKQLENLLVAADITAELEMSSDIVNGSEVISRETKIKPGMGIAYLTANGLGAGFELRNDNIFKSGELKHSALFAGATISYASESIWFTISFLPQVHSFKGGTTVAQNLDLGEFEKFQTRLLLAFHF